MVDFIPYKKLIGNLSSNYMAYDLKLYKNDVLQHRLTHS